MPAWWEIRRWKEIPGRAEMLENNSRRTPWNADSTERDIAQAVSGGFLVNQQVKGEVYPFRGYLHQDLVTSCVCHPGESP